MVDQPLPDYEELLRTQEDLHPDLVPYLGETERFGMRTLQHPLIYEIPYLEAMNALINTRYEAISKAAASAAAEGKWERYLMFHERPWRITAFTTIADELGDSDYWRILGQLWTDAEFVHALQEEWLDLLTCSRPHREQIMNADERAALAKFPEVITVYRGAREASHVGPSWTLSQDKALWFARRWSDHGGEPGILMTVEVSKSQALAYFDGRNEQEVLIDPRELAGITTKELP